MHHAGTVAARTCQTRTAPAAAPGAVVSDLPLCPTLDRNARDICLDGRDRQHCRSGFPKAVAGDRAFLNLSSGTSTFDAGCNHLTTFLIWPTRMVDCAHSVAAGQGSQARSPTRSGWLSSAPTRGASAPLSDNVLGGWSSSTGAHSHSNRGSGIPTRDVLVPRTYACYRLGGSRHGRSARILLKNSEDVATATE